MHTNRPAPFSELDIQMMRLGWTSQDLENSIREARESPRLGRGSHVLIWSALSERMRRLRVLLLAARMDRDVDAV
jgi:hypothetical protein